MPTGYTAELYEGKEQTFEEFALICSRGMGAMILLRDEPLTAQLPERFEVSQYNFNHMLEVWKKLEEVRAWSADEASQYAREAWIKDERQVREANDNHVAMQERYEAMLAKVRAWEPPTPDHEGLKKFMTEQLEESIRFDCSYKMDAPVKLTGEEYRAQQIAFSERELRYHAKSWAEELQRTYDRNEWIRKLRESLEGGK